MLSFTTDRTGFPMVVVKPLKLDVHLFPVLKQQFEMFLAEPNPFDDSWYETILKMNPRSPRADEDPPERSFLTGILPSEATHFAAWLGDEYRLPTVAEWHGIHERFTRERRPKVGWTIFVDAVDQGAQKCVDVLLQGEENLLMTKLSRMDHGVMEWIRGRHRWQIVGEPRRGFGHQLFSHRTPVTPTNVDKRNRLCGFRLVRDHSER